MHFHVVDVLFSSRGSEKNKLEIIVHSILKTNFEPNAEVNATLEL